MVYGIDMKYDFNNIKNMKEALLWSIAKWQGIFDGKIIDKLTDNCGCCQFALKREGIKKFNPYKFARFKCIKCRISQFVNKEGCSGTPYVDRTDYENERKWVKSERDFLINVYKKYYGKFTLMEFKKTHYPKMLKELKKI